MTNYARLIDRLRLNHCASCPVSRLISEIERLAADEAIVDRAIRREMLFPPAKRRPRNAAPVESVAAPSVEEPKPESAQNPRRGVPVTLIPRREMFTGQMPAAPKVELPFFCEACRGRFMSEESKDKHHCIERTAEEWNS